MPIKVPSKSKSTCVAFNCKVLLALPYLFFDRYIYRTFKFLFSKKSKYIIVYFAICWDYFHAQIKPPINIKVSNQYPR